LNSSGLILPKVVGVDTTDLANKVPEVEICSSIPLPRLDTVTFDISGCEPVLVVPKTFEPPPKATDVTPVPPKIDTESFAGPAVEDCTILPPNMELLVVPPNGLAEDPLVKRPDDPGLELVDPWNTFPGDSP
jgi:hypothetical protein